jgi:uncharacterized protein YxjI
MSEFADYCFCPDWDGNGEIYNREGEVVWRFRSAGSNWNEGVPLFVFSGTDGKELALVRREKRFPLARFAVFENAVRTCTIWQRTLTLSRYDLAFENAKWTLRMPMFSVRMRATSADGSEILIRVQSRKQWFVRLPMGKAEPSLLTALAYVTRKKLQCT